MSLLSVLAKGVAATKPALPKGVNLKKAQPARSLTESDDPVVNEDRFPENAVDQIALLPGSPVSKAWRGFVKGAFRENRYEND